MIFGWKKKKKPQEESQQVQDVGRALNLVVRVVIFAVIGYAFFQYITGEAPPGQILSSTEAKRSERIAPKYESCLCLPERKSLIFGTFWPVAEPYISYTDEQEGDGEPAVCGQDVTVSVQPVEDSYFPGDADKPLTFRVGTGAQIRGLELGVLGLRTGGERQMKIPPVYAYLKSTDVSAPQKQPVSLKTKLLDVRPAQPQSAAPARAFMTQVGQGIGAKCGDRVALQLDLWSSENELLFSTRLGEAPSGPLKAKIGMGQLPFGLEQALQKIRPGGEWSFVFPAAMMVRFNPPQGKAAEGYPPLLKEVALPESGVIIADMVLLEVLEPESEAAAAPAVKQKRLLPAMIKETAPETNSTPLLQEPIP